MRHCGNGVYYREGGEWEGDVKHINEKLFMHHKVCYFVKN